jgi:hypothetical protein
MAAVNGLLDDRKDVLGMDLDLALFRLQHHDAGNQLLPDSPVRRLAAKGLPWAGNRPAAAPTSVAMPLNL